MQFADGIHITFRSHNLICLAYETQLAGQFVQFASCCVLFAANAVSRMHAYKPREQVIV